MQNEFYSPAAPRGDDLVQLACTCRVTLRCTTCVLWRDLIRTIGQRRRLSGPLPPPKMRRLICDLPEVVEDGAL